MNTRATLRRTTATLAAVAVLFTAGSPGGLLTQVALAGALPAAVVTSVAPSSWDNRSKVTLRVNGSGFLPGDLVVLEPACSIAPAALETGDPCPPLDGPEIGELVTEATTPNPTAGFLTVTMNLSMAPAGRYRLVVRHASPDGTESPSPAFPNFTIFGYGGANASGVVAGLGANGIDLPGVIYDVGCGNINDGCHRKPRALDVLGSNIALGARVRFLRQDGTPDPGLSFVYGNPSNGRNRLGTADDTSFPSATLLQGAYDYAADLDASTPGFTPGFHRLQVVNADGNVTGATVAFSQPWFAPEGAVTPTRIGEEASQVLVSVTGVAIRAGSKLGVAGPAGCITNVGESRLTGVTGDGTYTGLSAPVSIPACLPGTKLAVSVLGPDGARFTREAITVTAKPKVFAISPATPQLAHLGQGAHVGFDAGSEVTIEGENFAGVGETRRELLPRFDFGPGVTVSTIAVISPGTALVGIDVRPDAPVGQHNVKVVNPDGGSFVTYQPQLVSPIGDPTKADQPFSVNPGPKITKVTPASFPSTTPLPTTVTVEGSGFATGIDRDDIRITPAGIEVTDARQVSPSTVSLHVVTAGAPSGPRDLIVENPTDFGRAICTGCLGVDSLDVVQVNDAPVLGIGEAPNTAVAKLTLEGSGVHQVTAASSVTLTRQVPLPGQPEIIGTAVGAVPRGTGLPTGDRATASFDLTHAAPGRYNVLLLLDPGASTPTTWSCSGCLQVAAAGPITTTKLESATGGQAAQGRLLTFTGTNFTRGMTVTIPDVRLREVTFVNPTTLTVLADIASTAPTGAKPVTVEAGDGSNPATATGSETTNLSFTVTAAPRPSALTPAAYGAGAGTAESGTTQRISVTAGDLDAQATAVLGPEVSTTRPKVTDGGAGTPPLIPPGADTLESEVSVAAGAPQGKRPLTVVNGDGGVGILADAFTVTPGPRISTVANEMGQPFLLQDGGRHTLTVFGTGFSTTDGKKAELKVTRTDGAPADFLVVENVVVQSPAKITFDATAAAAGPQGALRLALRNPTDEGFGQCLDCLAIANLPGPAAPLTATGDARSIRASWAAAPPNGSPVTHSLATITRTGEPDPIATERLGGDVTHHTFTGLVNGASYTVTVAAVSAVGRGPATTASGIAGLPVALTLTITPRTIVSGARVTLTGTLTGNGTALPGQPFVLALTPSVGRASSKVVTTNSSGRFSLVLAPPYTTRVQAVFAADTTYRAGSTSQRVIVVATRVTRSTPAAGASTGSAIPLTVTGTVSPNKSGRVIGLYRLTPTGRVLVARTTVTSRSQFRFTIRPARGSYTFRISIGATPGNAAGSSAAFTHRRA